MPSGTEYDSHNHSDGEATRTGDHDMGRTVTPTTKPKNEPPPRTVEFLDDIIGRIVRIATPQRIILFGSSARGDSRPESDLDLLVVTAGEIHRGRLTGAIYEGLIGAGRAVDVVVVTPEDIARYRDSPALVIAAALRDGRDVYAA